MPDNLTGVSSETVRNRIVKLAESFIGAHETPMGSNWGEPVKSFLAAAGVKSPAPWCAAFVTDILKQCGVEIPVANPAYVPSWVDWMDKNDAEVEPTSARPGDLFALWFGKKHRHAHIGIVVENLGRGKLRTIEGNTDANGSRTGGQVMERVRVVGANDVVIRVVRDGGPEADWSLLQELISSTGHMVPGDKYQAAFNRLRGK